MDTLTQYRIELGWSEEDEAFVATVPALPGCAADGPTPEDALREVRIALQGHLAARRKHGLSEPQDPLLAQLRRIAPFVKMATLARHIGMAESTLRSKVERGTPIAPAEAARIKAVLAQLA